MHGLFKFFASFFHAAILVHHTDNPTVEAENIVQDSASDSQIASPQANRQRGSPTPPT